jgi:hypothetical protein
MMLLGTKKFGTMLFGRQISTPLMEKTTPCGVAHFALACLSHRRAAHAVPVHARGISTLHFF